MSGFDFAKMDVERGIARRLMDHGVDIFKGDTNPASRQEAFRKAIKQHRLEYTVFGSNAAGKTETYAQMFHRVYGMKL